MTRQNITVLQPAAILLHMLIIEGLALEPG